MPHLKDRVVSATPEGQSLLVPHLKDRVVSATPEGQSC